MILSYVDSDIDDMSALELSDEETAQVLGLLERSPEASAFATEVQMELQRLYFVGGWPDDTTPTFSEFAAWTDDCRAKNEGL